MSAALFLYRGKNGFRKYWIRFTLVKRGNSSCTFTGERHKLKIEGNTCTYTDMFENVYSFTIPNFEERGIFSGETEISVYHDNNKQRIVTKKPKNTWYTRVVFSNPELRHKIQILFLYDDSLTPRSLPMDVINERLYINR